MTSDAAKKRKAIRERVKGQAGDDLDQHEPDVGPTDGSTCLYALYVVALAAGVLVLLALISVHNKAGISGPRMEEWTSIRPPAVQEHVVQTIYRSPQDPPPQEKPAEAIDISGKSSLDALEAADSNKPPVADAAGDPGTGGAASAGDSIIDGADGGTASSRADSGERAAIDPANAVPAEPLSVAPDPSERVQEPLQYVPIPIDTVQLEGSEPMVESAPPHHPEQVLAQQEVRVRQVIQRKIHDDGSVTEEVVAEYVLKPGDEGYDDLGKEPVTVSHGEVPPSAAIPEDQATVKA